MADDKMELQRIPLGSGKIYGAEYDSTLKALMDNIPNLIKTVVKEDNNLGKVSGGASLEYKPTFKTYTDDLGTVTRTIMTTDEATLKGGICTWNGNTMKRLCNTARVEEDTTNNLRIVKLGGVGNYDGKLWVIIFVNEDKDYGKSYLIIVGNNQKGITIGFEADKETVINPEFSAQACDDAGTKVIYVEKLDYTKATFDDQASITQTKNTGA